MTITTDEVERAVLEFYYGSATQVQAHQWLTAAQISPQAWNFCWDLMSLSKSPELQFFGASTLHVKVAKFWHELPADQYVELRKKMLEYVLNYCGGPKIVLTRLCIALSSYVVHTIPEHWVKAIPDIVNTFQPANVPNQCPNRIASVLLEILTVLPEEFQCMTLAHSYRAVVRRELKSGLSQVLMFLQHVFINMKNSELHLQLIKCFSSWVQFGVPLPECEPLMPFILEATQNEELCETALDSLATVICHQDVHMYPHSVQKLIAQILSLENLLIQSLQERDMDRCYSIYYLFTNIGETHSRLLLESVLHEGEAKENALRLVQLILQCAGTTGQFPVEEACSGLVFNFWYLFQDDITAADQNKQIIYRSYFSPIYVALVEVLINKVMLPSDELFKSWNSDDKEQFRCYRQDIQDTMMYCYNLLRENMLQLLHHHLNVALVKNREDPLCWRMLEACLVVFEAIADSVDLEENCFLPHLIALLPTLPFSNVKVVSATLAVVGAYAEWMNMHSSELNNIVPLLIMGLRSPEIVPAATVALREITRDCHLNMKPFAEQILTESENVLKTGNLNSNEKMRLMCTIGRMLSVLEVDTVMSYLNSLLTPYLQELEILTDNKSGPNVPPSVVVTLQMLAALAANLDTKMKEYSDEDKDQSSHSNKWMDQSEHSPNVPHPVLLILQKIMPVIYKVSISWSDDSTVIETVCDFLKKAVSTLLDDGAPLVADILNLIVILYRVRPRVPALELSKQLILLFGKDQMHAAVLSSMFSHISDATLNLFEKGIAEHTDIVEGFLQFLSQVLKKQPTFLLSQDVKLETLFHCGVVALSLLEAPTVKAASTFLVNFINHSREVPSMACVVNIQGETLVEQTLRCIGGEAPRGVIDNMADILLALNKKYFDNLCQWMNIFLNREGFPSTRLNQDQKEHYTRLILKERANKRKLQETVKEYSLLCRGLYGTDYANQIMPFL